MQLLKQRGRGNKPAEIQYLTKSNGPSYQRPKIMSQGRKIKTCLSTSRMLSLWGDLPHTRLSLHLLKKCLLQRRLKFGSDFSKISLPEKEINNKISSTEKQIHSSLGGGGGHEWGDRGGITSNKISLSTSSGEGSRKCAVNISGGCWWLWWQMCLQCFFLKGHQCEWFQL